MQMMIEDKKPNRQEHLDSVIRYRKADKTERMLTYDFTNVIALQQVQSFLVSET